MTIRKMIKNGKYTGIMYRKLVEAYLEMLTCISPRLNTRVRYKLEFGKYPNLSCPSTFNEKLLYLKLNNYIHNPLVIQCADKYRVRDYIKECGCADILNELYTVYDSADKIEWEKLPNRFVLKWNFGAGLNFICSDKSSINTEEVTRQLKTWGKTKPWRAYSEMQYKYAPKKILCEQFLQDDKETIIPDYKVYCFNGKPEAVFVMHDRGRHIKTEFFDMDWNPLNNSKKYEKTNQATPRPVCLEYMAEVCKKLSKPFPFVRCDFYIVNEKLYFGEMTFTPAGGLFTSETVINGKSMAELLNINYHED